MGRELLDRAADDKRRSTAERRHLRRGGQGRRRHAKSAGRAIRGGDRRPRSSASSPSVPSSACRPLSATRSIQVERTRAGVGSWYEFFPRSEGAKQLADGSWKSGTFRTAAKRLPEVAAMGFDVVYLPPIHPIGRTFRKGPNNSLDAGPNDPGSPVGHRRRRGRPRRDPSRTRHGEGLRLLRRQGETGRPGGRARPRAAGLSRPPVGEDSIRNGSRRFPTARSPTPRTRRRSTRTSTRSTSTTTTRASARRSCASSATGCPSGSASSGSTIRTPSRSRFWEWLIHTVNATDPDVVFLAEAFTRPALLHTLAKAGFQQSYTYFTWRNTKEELEEFLDRARHRDRRLPAPEPVRQHAGHPDRVPPVRRAGRVQDPGRDRGDGGADLGRLLRLRALRERRPRRSRGVHRQREVRVPPARLRAGADPRHSRWRRT